MSSPNKDDEKLKKYKFKTSHGERVQNQDRSQPPIADNITEMTEEDKLKATVYENEDSHPPSLLNVAAKKATKEEEEDPCIKKEAKKDSRKYKTPGLDPRFQQQNQTLRCWVMYEDFYRCEKILGEGQEACEWFKEVFTSICPEDWIKRWDNLKDEGRLPWSKGDKQGTFPGDRYGV